MKKAKIIVALLLVLLMSVSLFACGGNTNSGGDSKEEEAPAEEAEEAEPAEEAEEPAEEGGEATPVTGNRVVFQMDTEPDCMDPSMNDYANGSMAIYQLFVVLFKYDAEGNVVPGCAESYEVSDDGLTWTFHLRDGLKWSDGQPLTAGDFEYGLKRMVNPEVSSDAAYTVYDYFKNARKLYVDGEGSLDDVGVKATDDSTLVIELENPTPWLPSLATAWCPIRQDAVEAHGDDWAYHAESYICNGPFVPSEMVPDEHYTFVKNENYYDAANVALDEVEYLFLGDEVTALLAWENGEIDIATSVSADAKEKYNGDARLNSFPRPGFRYYEVNSEKITDPKVRKALAMGLDRQTLVDSSIKDSSLPVLRGWVPYSIADPVEEGKEWRETHDMVFEEDYEAAKQLLADAGYPDGAGLTIELVSTNDATLTKVSQAMAQMWKQNLGIETEIKTVESGVFWADDTGTRSAGDFDVCYMGYTGDFDDPLALLMVFANNNGEDVIRWQNAEYQDIIKQLYSGVTGEERVKLCEQAEAILAEEVPVIPVYSYVSNALVNERVNGFIRINGGAPRFEYVSVSN